MHWRNIASHTLTGTVPTLCLIVGIILSGCDSVGNSPNLTTRDSAGITIVSNPATTGNDQFLRVDSSESLRIGTLDGPSPTRFAGVRAATQLENGMIAVSDAQSREIRVFDSVGAHVVTFGREGDGPGEFRSPVNVESRHGDTLIAWDTGPFRRSTFSVRAGLIKTEQLGYADIFHGLDGLRSWGVMLRDGSFVIGAQEGWKVRPQLFQVYRLPTLVKHVSADLMTTTEVATYPGPEEFLTPGAEAPNVSVERPPFSRRGLTASGGDPPRICTGDTGVPEIRCYQSGSSRLFLRWQQRTIPVTSQDIENWRNERRRGLSSRAERDRQEMERILANTPVPKMKPYYSGLMVDDAHRIWVEHDTESNVPTVRRFTVFAADGRLLGSAHLPNVTILEIGAAHMLAVVIGARGFEVVTRYNLR